MPSQTTKLLKARGDQSPQIIPDPSESSVHGKEIHVAKQQQTQKEVCKHLNYSNLLSITYSNLSHRYKAIKKYVEKLLPLRRLKWNTHKKTKKGWSKEKL